MKITTEEPNEHWGFLSPNDKIVLDLGCNEFYSSISTAQWFLDNGAKKVIGIDLSVNQINDDRFEPISMSINDKLGLEFLITKYKPQIIKCDIEGSEDNFDGIDSIDMLSVLEFAVEYHDMNTKKICETKIKEWGFKNIELYQLFNEDINRIGVFHAWR